MDSKWRLSLFGKVGLYSDQGCLDTFETKRASKLLVLLCLSRTGKMRRDELADILWPDDFLDSTRLRLRQELNRLKKGLGPIEWIVETTTETISVNRENIYTDLDRLAELESLTFEELMLILQDPFLPSWDDPWVLAKRLEVAQIQVNCAVQTATKLVQERQFDKALEILRSAQKLAPGSEQIRDLTMKCHRSLGSLSGALSEFRRFESESSSSDIIELSEEGEKLSVVHAPVVPIFELPQPPHPIDRFFGRESHSQQITKFIQDRNGARLLSLVGMGGIGKTRLAIEACRQLDQNFGYVSFIECLHDSRPDLFLLQTLVPGENSPEPVSTIKRVLEGKECFLVLDNLEHLDEPGKFVTSLLTAVSDLRLIITSRRRMKVAGESVIEILPLDPDKEALPMLVELTGTKRINSQQTELYRQIVDLCGGIPLTIRLAAARLRTLEPEELVSELQQSTTLLKADLPDLDSRHRDLNQMLRLSIASLTEFDASSLLTFSYFPGGISRAIAKRIVGTDVDDLLERLLDSALIWLDDDVSPVRFRLLEPVRQFIQEELVQENQLISKAIFVQQMAKEAESFFDCWNIACDSQDARYLSDRENFRRAIRVALEIGSESAMFLFQKTWTFELPVGQISDLVHLSEQLEERYPENPLAMGHLHLCRCWCRSAEGNLDEAALLARVAKGHFDQASDLEFSSYALATAFEHERYKLPWESVLANYAEAFASAEKHIPNFLPVLRVWRGTIFSIKQEWELATEDLESAYRLSQETGSFSSQIYSGVALLSIDFKMGRYDQLRNRIIEMRRVFESFQNRQCLSVFLRAEARVALLDHDYNLAETFAQSALQVTSQTGNNLYAIEVMVSLARSLIAQGRFDEASQVIKEMAISVPSQMFRIAIMALACKAENLSNQGCNEEAKQVLGKALAYKIANNIEIQAMEQPYFEDLVTKLGATTLEKEISADELHQLLLT